MFYIHYGGIIPTMKAKPTHILLVVDDEPFCVWDQDCRDNNRKFLENFDPYIYSTTCELLQPALDSPETKIHAATAIRIQYGLALETHFSLLFAAAQSPSAAYAWVSKYSNSALRKLIDKTESNENILSSWKTSISGWESILEVLLPANAVARDISQESYKSLRAGFLRLWRNLATDIVSELHISEYNSFKHGGRAYVGSGSMLEISASAHFENPMKIGGGDYGSKHLRLKRHPSLRGHHQVCSTVALNWDPKILCVLVDLMAESVASIRASILHQLGYHDTFEISVLDDDIFDRGLAVQNSLRSFELNQGTSVGGSKPTKSEIIERYANFRKPTIS